MKDERGGIGGGGVRGEGWVRERNKISFYLQGNIITLTDHRRYDNVTITEDDVLMMTVSSLIIHI